MREILFKAKRIDNGEWVEGCYECDPDLDNHYICGFDYYSSENGLERDFFTHEVDKNTICQYTGLTDKNGVKIWENDIVYARCHGLSGKGIIKFDKGCFVLEDTKRKRTYSLFGEWMLRKDGNVFDNPELLKEGAE